jgi:hypothetical protein
MITAGIRPHDALTPGRIRLSHRAGRGCGLHPTNGAGRCIHGGPLLGTAQESLEPHGAAHVTRILRPTSAALQDIDPETTLR